MRQHRPFLVALALGVVARVLVSVAFWPGLVFSDGPTYLYYFTYEHVPSAARPAGYPSLLWALGLLGSPIVLGVLLQHLLGLLAGVLVYVVLRRWDVRGWVATLAALPVLLDGMQLALEQMVLSDVLFEVLLVVAVAVLAWNRTPTTGRAALAGLVLAAATLVRVAGEPTVVPAVLFCLLAAVGWRRRAVTAAVLVVAFLVPVVGYAAWFSTAYGHLGLTELSGRSLYMRTTGFVECDRLQGLPSYERTLCPDEPVGRRLDPTDYAWHSPDHTAGMTLPAGVTEDEAFGDFARRALRAQPGAYVRIVLRDSALLLSPTRTDADEYDTADKWQLSRYTSNHLSAEARQAYRDHGAPQLKPVAGLATAMASYQNVVYLWGPLMGLLVAVALAGLVRRSRNRPLVVLTLLLGVGLLLLPIMTVEFVWRYALPGIPLLPMAAAAAWASPRRVPEEHHAVAEDPSLERAQT